MNFTSSIEYRKGSACHVPLDRVWFLTCLQHVKKVVADSPGLVDFAIGLVIFVLNLPDGQVFVFGKFKLQKDCNQSC